MTNQILTKNINQEELDNRFIELYNAGYRTSVILDKMEQEFGYTVWTLYKKLSIEDLKSKARKLSTK